MMSEAPEIGGELEFPTAEPHRGIATPWARFWAKLFDLWLAASIVFAVWFGAVYFAARTPALAPMVNALLNGDQSSATTSSTPNYLGNLVFLFIAFIVDAWVQATFGTTLGLKFIGARLERIDHTRLSFREAFQRNMGILVYGFWLGILAPIAFVMNYLKAGRGEVMNWDQSTQTRVFNYHGSVWRSLLAALCLFALVAARLTLTVWLNSLSA
jgi:uncharacterized RDD family membrane protein YckC